MRKQFLLLVFMFAGISGCLAFTKSEAIETARETWWYFRQKLEWKPQTTGFLVKLQDDNWYVATIDRYKGLYIAQRLIFKSSAIDTVPVVFDSTMINDWAFREDGYIRGAFTIRVGEIDEAYKLLPAYLNSKLLKEEVIGSDFSSLSRWDRKSDEDDKRITQGIFFLNSRFKGGADAFFEFLGSNITYPHFARSFLLCGCCYIKFVIAKDGSINNVTVLQSIGGGTKKMLNMVIGNLPSFKPDENSSQVSFILPVNIACH